jgi:asparagine synthase (glutamine-hydrolysing)
MCGIAGLVGRLQPDAPRALARMTTALRHRGPDDEGYLLAGGGRARCFRGPDTLAAIADPPLPAVTPAGAWVALGNRRLAILDLGPGGHGPMGSADGQLWVTYNGEIFNYLELREELRGRGHAFRTACDTEVLLAAYAEWGDEAWPRLNGMFAFALYDARARAVVCVRDRFGVKPFFYGTAEGRFAFASEIKALFAHPGLPCRPDEEMVCGFLAAGALDESDRTFFAGVQSLPGGHALRVGEDGRVAVRRWYELPRPDPRPADPDEFRALLEDSVRLRLRSDVAVGTCLSGGLDSSSIVALTARLRGPQAAGAHCSFSIVYPEPGLDESPFIEAVVRETGVRGTRTTPRADELVRDLPALVRSQDEPFPSAGIYSQWRVMRAASEAGVRVLLDGQGGDEVLGGYRYHLGPFLAETVRARGWTAAAREIAQIHATSGVGRPLLAGLLAYHALPVPAALRARAIARFASHRRLDAAVLDPAVRRRLGSAAASGRHRRRASLLEERREGLLRTSLPALLRYEDRNSMAFSVEARTPFLDFRLVERALALPSSDLVHGGWTKAILRDAMAGIIPDAVRWRRDKLGFATPETRWLREMAPHVREWLGPQARIRGLLRADVLDAWAAGSDESLARRSGLWRVLSVELWLRHVEDLARAA